VNTTYHSIGFRWSNPVMSGLHDCVLDLSFADQDDPRMAHVHALVDWWREKAREANAAAPTTKGGFPLG
jgi:hypothetical protein